MKKIFIYLFVVLSLFACKEGEKKVSEMNPEEKQNIIKDSANFTTIKWIDSTSQNIGKVKKGQVVEIAYKLENSGNKPLVITSVEPGCGCTVAEKPEKPIEPGGTDKIVAKFNSESQSVGTHSKNITVRANTKPLNSHLLTFSVEVVE